MRGVLQNSENFQSIEPRKTVIFDQKSMRNWGLKRPTLTKNITNFAPHSVDSYFSFCKINLLFFIGIYFSQQYLLFGIMIRINESC